MQCTYMTVYARLSLSLPGSRGRGRGGGELEK